MGLNNHAQRSTPSYQLDVDNPFDKKLFQFMRSVCTQKIQGGPVNKKHPVPIGSDEIMKRHKIWLNNPQQGHKEGQNFPFFLVI